MYDMHIILKNSPGELAWLGKTLALNGIGIEGGGVFALGGESHAHFLVADGYKAKTVLESEGFRRLRRMPPVDQSAKAGT
jgi:hypothetical protein